ncbi:hypothetical protein [Lentibacillus amyloliquefaciens]|uniref:Uncharacterized protein n=1 Tax=Lentibacillus amyloliquefaciens TaxID=1472767 RepID=A0A0U4FIR7_9BACI|nr:hypothetical protein [Lentibacillus amyloliquefaciens]ALX50445.1 hypothetical protein AOX59_18785 [Lentibacillus amyloliquefaciens]
MNYESATKEQLLQVALNEDCSNDDKFKACRYLIKFKISEYRKVGSAEINFDGELSEYWQYVYESTFKGW